MLIASRAVRAVRRGLHARRRTNQPLHAPYVAGRAQMPASRESEAGADEFIAGFIGSENYAAGCASIVGQDTSGSPCLRTVRVGEAALEQHPHSVRVVLISDTHETHGRLSIPAGDVLIHCGDVLMLNRLYTVESSDAKLRQFNNWMSALPHKEKVVVGGNHDFRMGQLGAARVQSLLSGCEYLENEARTLKCGLRVFGSPASFANSTASQNRAFQLPEAELERIFARAAREDGSRDVDILVTHGPVELLQPALSFLRETQTKLSVWGHVHEDHGVKRVALGDGQHVVGINAATMGSSFAPTNPPVVIDVIPKSHAWRNRPRL